MRYEPHEYQTYATNYILDHPVSALLLSMGLGKTIITLSAIHELALDRFEVKRVLVVAPLRVCTNVWGAELGKWDHLKGLTYSVAVGTEAQRRLALKQDTIIHIINRENVAWLSRQPHPHYDMIVIDELSSFKSREAKRWSAMLQLRRYATRVIGLTGTPSPNSLMDLWAEYRILDLGERLGRFITPFRNAYFTPDARNGNIIYSYKLRPDAEEAMYRKIGDITISMKSLDHLHMPGCVYNEVVVLLDETEMEHVARLKAEYAMALDGREITALNAASLSLKLLQMANGAVYSDDQSVVRIHDRKLDALEDLIEAANGKPVLIAIWFKHDAARIMGRFKAERLDDEKSIAKWNAGQIPVGLIHPASAGHGLNLQAGGSTLVWFGLTWSLELYQQTNARLWRQGQRETVVIHHLVAKDTIDEQVLKALKRKDTTQSALIDAVKYQIGGCVHK